MRCAMKSNHLLYFLLVVSSSTFSASFDCEKAKSPTEKLICGDKAISKLDEQLAVSYKAALRKSTDKDTLKKTQLDWLKQQRACIDVKCLNDIYLSKINELNQFYFLESEKSSSSSSVTSSPDTEEIEKLVDPIQILKLYLKQRNIDMDNSNIDDVLHKIRLGPHNAEWSILERENCNQTYGEKCTVIETHIELARNCDSIETCKLQKGRHKGGYYEPNTKSELRELGFRVYGSRIYIDFIFDQNKKLYHIDLKYGFHIRESF